MTTEKKRMCCTAGEWVSERLLFNAKWEYLSRQEFFNEMMMLMFALYKTNMLHWIFIF